MSGCGRGGGCCRRGEDRGESLYDTLGLDGRLLRDMLPLLEDPTMPPPPAPPLPGMLLPMAPYAPPGEEKSWSPRGWFSPWGVSGVPGGAKLSSDWVWSWEGGLGAGLKETACCWENGPF